MNTSAHIDTWRDVRVFLAVADGGNLSAAAEQLDLSQPTVGRRLNALESRLGAPLFVRGGRRMQLTDAGQAILESARRMEREMRAIERAVDVQAKGLSGEVTITATEGTGTEWLAPELIGFHRRYPDILLNVRVENRSLDLVHREADIALRLARPTQPDLIARRLVDVHFGLYASRSYLAERGPVASVADLERHDVIGIRDPGGVAQLMFGDSTVLGGTPGRLVFVSNSVAAQMSAARAGYGVAVLSCRWASMYPELVRVVPDVVVHSAQMWLVTHEELKHSARIRAVSDYLAERVLAGRALFEQGGPDESDSVAVEGA